MSASDPCAWIGKAQQETRSARRLLLDPPESEDAAFHVPQAVEKAIKAILVAEGVRYPRGRGVGHDLDALTRLIPSASGLREQAEQLAGLTPWATAFRYPADDPLTAEPLPAKAELERTLDAAEAFVEAVARRVAQVS